MRFVFLLLCLGIGSLRAQAQSTVVYSEDFRVNTKSWLEETALGHSMTWSPGLFTIEQNSGKGGVFSLRTQQLDDFVDWKIEATIEQFSGVKDHGYGLVFRAIDADSCYLFLINSEGKASVLSWTGVNYNFIVRWRPCPQIRSNTSNTLSIVHQFDNIAFLVNGTCIGSISATECRAFGDRFGFYIEDVMKIGVRSVRVMTDIVDHQVNAVPDGGLDLQHQNLGRNVNSSATEINAIVSADDKTLYMIRRDFEGNVGSERRDDIWFCRRNAQGGWSAAENIGLPLNTAANNSVISVAPDNNTLLLQGYYEKGKESETGLSITHREGSTWSAPKAVTIDSLYNLHPFMEFSLSPDERVLIASLEQFDTKGSKDLYVCYRTSDTSFSRPHHIPELSTIGSDMAPYIATDGTTMYFSTDGRAGYGSEDIFVTTRLDSTWKHWSEPRNLGPKINTPYFDAYFHTTARGDSAYMMTYAKTYGSSDIVRIAVPPEARPKTVCLISGHVYDAKTKKPLGAGVRYEFLSTNTEAGFARSNPSDGAYNIALPAGNMYGFFARAENYYPVSEQLDTRSLRAYQELNRDLYLVPIEKEATIRLNNLFFDFAKAELRSESASELDRLIDFLKSRQSMSIVIAGHTDSVGEKATNLSLSRNRAQAVLSYLRQKGVQKNRLRCVGYGSTKPIDSNETEEGRQRNRRVEFVIEKN